MPRHTVSMPKVLSFPESPVKDHPAPIDPDRRKVLDAVKLMLSTLTGDELQEIIEEFQPIAAPRAGEVLGAIVKFLPRRQEWSVGEIKEQVAASGVRATDKEVYNSIGYLTRKRHIQRVGYGRYLVDGVEPWRDECE